MEQSFVKDTYNFFEKLVEIHGFKIKTQINEEQSYMIEFSSSDFVLKIEKYFREFYATLYKIDRPDNEVNLFNLLEYLRQGDTQIPKSEYFSKEKDIQEGYRKQLAHISSVIYENYRVINDFFSNEDYEIKLAEFEKYWKNKHPELYKKVR